MCPSVSDIGDSRFIPKQTPIQSVGKLNVHTHLSHLVLCGLFCDNFQEGLAISLLKKIIIWFPSLLSIMLHKIVSPTHPVDLFLFYFTFFFILIITWHNVCFSSLERKLHFVFLTTHCTPPMCRTVTQADQSVLEVILHSFCQEKARLGLPWWRSG